MATLTPVYRLTLFASLLDDPTESTPLSPRDSSIHSDPFQVASSRGVDGYQPFLEHPRGRRGRIDPLTRQTDTGQLTLRCIDKRTHDDNARRWATAFLGDLNGKARLIGRKVLVEEDLGDGGGFLPFFTGRVEDLRLGTRLFFDLIVRDMAEELGGAVFVGRPHSSVAYAHRAPVLPNGTSQAYGPFAAEPALSGLISDTGAGAERRTITIGAKSERRRAYATKHVFELSKAGSRAKLPNVRVLLTTSGGQSGEFDLYPIGGTMRATEGYRMDQWFELEDEIDKTSQGVPVKHHLVKKLGIQQIPGGMAVPAPGTTITFRVVDDRALSEDSPLLIEDVHPVQLWRDMIEGKFSRLDAAGNTIRTVAYDPESFDTLIENESIPTARFIIQEESRLNEWIEKHICLPCNLAYRLDAQGRVVPIDMRLPSSLPAVPTITSLDVAAAEPPTWTHGRKDAVTRIQVTHYVDDQVTRRELEQDPDEYPAVPASRIFSQDHLRIELDFNAEKDLGEHPLEIDAIGFRSAPFETKAGQDRADWVARHIDGLVSTLRGPYGAGAMMARLRCRRTAPVKSCQPGDWRIVDVDELPDPASNLRGGARLMRCIERTENGPTIEFSFIDAGPGSVAVAPTIDSIALDVTGSRPSLVAAITTNVAGDRVRVEIAVTSNAVAVQPAENSSLWTFGALALATENLDGSINRSATVRIDPVPDNSRIWVRARSE